MNIAYCQALISCECGGWMKPDGHFIGEINNVATYQMEYKCDKCDKIL